MSLFDIFKNQYGDFSLGNAIAVFSIASSIYVAGYSAHNKVATDPKYRIGREHDVPVLIERATEQQYPIIEIKGKPYIGGPEHCYEGYVRMVQDDAEDRRIKQRVGQTLVRETLEEAIR